MSIKKTPQKSHKLFLSPKSRNILFVVVFVLLLLLLLCHCDSSLRIYSYNLISGGDLKIQRKKKKEIFSFTRSKVSGCTNYECWPTKKKFCARSWTVF